MRRSLAWGPTAASPLQSVNLSRELPTALGFLPAEACSFPSPSSSSSSVSAQCCLSPTGSGAVAWGRRVRGSQPEVRIRGRGHAGSCRRGAVRPGVRNLRVAAAGPGRAAQEPGAQLDQSTPMGSDACPPPIPAGHIRAEGVGAARAGNHVCGQAQVSGPAVHRAAPRDPSPTDVEGHSAFPSVGVRGQNSVTSGWAPESAGPGCGHAAHEQALCQGAGPPPGPPSASSQVRVIT